MPLNREDRAGRGKIKKYEPTYVAPKPKHIKKKSHRERKMDWRLNRVLGVRVEPATPGGPRLVQRMKMRVATSYKNINAVSFGANALHQTEHISMQEVLQNDETGDLFLAALWEFMRELYLAAPSQAGLSALLGNHHPESLPPLTDAQRAVMRAAFERA